MKKITSVVLAMLLALSAVAVNLIACAEDDTVVASYNYSELYNEIVDKKTSALVTKGDESQGEKAVKVVPNIGCTDSDTIALDCWSFKLPASELVKAKYITVKYKYVSPTSGSVAKKMDFALAATGGALPKYTQFTNTLDTVANNWAYALFDITSIADKIVNEEEKILKQFHVKPYGGAKISALTTDEVYYISEIAFHSEKPEIKNPSNGTAPAATAQPAKPAQPAQPAQTVKPTVDADVPDVIITFNYSDKNNGVVDHKNSAECIKDDTTQGEKALKIVPNKVDSTEAKVALDCYSLKYPATDMMNVRYATVRYKYVAPGEAHADTMNFNILTGGTKFISGSANAQAPIVPNEWTEAIFDFTSLPGIISNPDGFFQQFHLLPFGNLGISNLDEGEIMYISDITFYSRNPDKNATYAISFVRGNPDADGTNPETLKVKQGEEYTLPENTYTLKNGTFLGWRSSHDNQLYKAGDTFVATDTNIKYTAEFSIAGSAIEGSKTLDFTSYCNGIVDHKTYAFTEKTTFDGKDAIKLTINKDFDNQATGIWLDGWSYNGAGVDIRNYNYLVISYYLEATLPKDAFFRINYMPRGMIKKTFGAASAEPLVAGKWAFATLDLSGVQELIVEGQPDYNLKQMHMTPFEGMTLADFNGSETLYISQLTFFKDKPDLVVHNSYMKGYDGGYFKPQGNMTRAEAATIVARLSAGEDALVPTDKTTAFTDVPSDQWYHKYISYVESLGYLKSYSGQFLPNQNITRAEFVELVYNMGLLKDAGKNGTFTDVPADHARASVIAAAGKAGLVNGYDNGDGTFSFKPDATITRAEVVTVINNAYGRRMKAEDLSEDVRFSFFDVPSDFWAYADICEATLSHVQTGEKWAYAIDSMAKLIAGTRDIDFAAAEAYLKELDAIAEAKKQAILSTKTEVEVTGTKYYVDATNGNDLNDGKTPETAWKTISKVNTSPLKAGDGVFFKRGDIYRTRMTTKSGVTYSAYGEGEKPRFYGSPENGAVASKWTLMPGSTNIWVYKTEMIDVGTIVLDFKEAALKEVPDLKDGKHYVRKTDTLFDIKTELNENHEFYHAVLDKNVGGALGKIYFRCDEGNPGEIYDSIEFNTRNNVIGVGGPNITFDNICVMFGGSHGIGSGSTKNLTVKNSVFGWIGGSIQHYNANGTVTRYGNGVEIYGGCDGYLIDNCYVYQCYDAGLTHQYGNGTNDNSMYNVTYSNNLIEDCIYSIEYFNGDSEDKKALRDGKNFLIKGNIMRRAGYGFGNQRPDANQSSHVKGWTSRNEYEKGTYIIEDNIFDRGMWSLFESRATYDAWCPIYRNNTYIQWMNGPIGYSKGGIKHVFDSLADITIMLELEDKGATVYWLPDSYKHHGFLTH